MVSCSVNVVTKHGYFDGETRGWSGFSLVTFRNFAVWWTVVAVHTVGEALWGAGFVKR
jgi:hypothetical protein